MIATELSIYNLNFMLIYYWILFTCYWASLLKNKILLFYILFFVAIFLCAGYMTGSDWRNYEIIYNTTTFGQINELREEIGYLTLQTLCKNLGIGFWWFHIILKLFVFICLCNLIGYLKINISLFWAFILPEIGFYLFIDCPFRNLLAMGIFCLSIPYLFNRKPVAYFSLIAIASLFHISALVLLFLYFVPNVSLRSRTWIILFVVASCSAYEVEFIILDILAPILNMSSFMNEKMLVYIVNDNFLNDKMNIGTLYRILIFVLLLYNRRLIETRHQYGCAIFSLAMLFLVIYPFTISFKIFNRFSIYMILFYLIASIILYYSLKRVIVKYAFLLLFVIWGGIRTYSVLSTDFRYVPYTNYFQYWSEELPTYSYRSSYNIQNSPYAKD